VPPDPPVWSEKTGRVDWNPLFIQRLGDRCYTRLLPTPPAMFEFKRNRLFFQSVLQDPLLPDRPALTPAPVELPPLPARFALFLPGAGNAVREWPAENYGRVARYLFDRHGLSIVVSGAAGDADKARRIAETAGLPVLDLTGRLNLPQLVALVARAELLLSNESGGIHLAAALGTKGVAVSMGISLIHFHPYPPDMKTSVRFVYPPAIRDAPSYEAYLAATPRGERIPIEDVSVESVLETVNDLLESGGAA
jgi:ADP-heptose:LPS heptosyltransferase